MRRLGTFALLALLIGPSAARAAEPRGLDIYFIDVLGGAATLVVTPEGESVLIDSGWAGFNDRDPDRIIHVLKDVAKLDHLDHIVTTHWHADHFGGVAGLAKKIKIEHFWDRGLPDLAKPDADRAEYPDGPKADDPLGMAYLDASRGKRKALKAGDSLPLKGDTKALVLASGGRMISPEFRYPDRAAEANMQCASAPVAMEPDRSDNARSLVLLFSYKNFQFLDCGDLTWNMEKALVCPKDLIGPIDLYQVTHHGIGISNNPVLVKTIAPTVTVMDNGPTKGGSPATVMLLKEIPSIKANYQLHRIANTKDEENTEAALIANKDPKGGQFVRVNVPPSGAPYTVRIGTDGAARSFDTN